MVGVMDELGLAEVMQLQCIGRAIGVVVLQLVQAATVLFSISTKVVNDVSGLRSLGSCVLQAACDKDSSTCSIATSRKTRRFRK